MIGLVVIVIYLFFIGAFWTIVVKSAPLGYEDENGFHYGKKR